MLRSCLLVALLVGSAFAGPGKPDPITQLGAVYRSITDAGPDQVKQACASIDPLIAAAAPISKQVPKGAAVDNEIWRGAVESVQLGLESIANACKSPTFEHHNATTNRDEYAPDLWPEISHNVMMLLEYAKPRALPAAFARFHAAIERARGNGKPAALCRAAQDGVKQVATLGHSVNDLDPDRWQHATDDLEAALKELEGFTCGRQPGTPDEIAGAQKPLHDAYYLLVVLVPPKP
jgi:hypothetical protein